MLIIDINIITFLVKQVYKKRKISLDLISHIKYYEFDESVSKPDFFRKITSHTSIFFKPC
jgi:hypothetical protein